jgi:acetoin utilization deacetylase AcuC-like enzyme
MGTLFVTHPIFEKHDTPIGHHECAARLEAVERALNIPAFASLTRASAPMGTLEAIERVHPASVIDLLRRATPTKHEGHTFLDADTVLSLESFTAALHGVGALCHASDTVMQGTDVSQAFCAVRPPGHHAERTTPMGVGLLNSVAIAAKHLKAEHGVERVAIVDFDVHHGNGTQDVFWDSTDTLFISSHGSPLYPGTGSASECGENGLILNLPLEAGTGSAAFRDAYETYVFPRLAAFKPDVLLVSAGFDAHRDDPLGNLSLESDDFHWLGLRLSTCADELCGGRLVSALEGGYNLKALEESVARFVSGLMGYSDFESERRL